MKTQLLETVVMIRGTTMKALSERKQSIFGIMPAMVLVLVFALALVACASDGVGTPSENNRPSSSNTSIPTQTQTQAQTPTQAQSPASDTDAPQGSDLADMLEWLGIDDWVYPSDVIDKDGMNLFWQSTNMQFAADENARLSLYISAEKNDTGEFLFDDGQDWLLALESSIGTYPLFPRQYVQLGKVSCTAYNGWNDDSERWDITHILVTMAGGAGFVIYDCVFDDEQKAFQTVPVYCASDINFMGRSD